MALAHTHTHTASAVLDQVLTSGSLVQFGLDARTTELDQRNRDVQRLNNLVEERNVAVASLKQSSALADIEQADRATAALADAEAIKIITETNANLEAEVARLNIALNEQAADTTHATGTEKQSNDGLKFEV